MMRRRRRIGKKKDDNDDGDYCFTHDLLLPAMSRSRSDPRRLVVADRPGEDIMVTKTLMSRFLMAMEVVMTIVMVMTILAELSRSEFDPEIFSHSAYVNVL